MVVTCKASNCSFWSLKFSLSTSTDQHLSTKRMDIILRITQTNIKSRSDVGSHFLSQTFNVLVPQANFPVLSLYNPIVHCLNKFNQMYEEYQDVKCSLLKKFLEKIKVVISDKFSDHCCKLIALCLCYNSCRSHRPFSLSFFN